MNFLKIYIIAFVVFLAIDALWLGLVAPKFYKAQIGHLMAEKPNFIAAGIFYLLFIVGLVYFIKPGIEAGELGKVVLSAAIFGFMAYATYDLTNLATLKDWPITVTIVDLIWGTFLSSTISLVTYLLYHWFW
ncbi:MAG: DUF2177 family protein [Candidatus Izemoplasmatales bacterium]|jgi:uncharacterized membrane protein